MFSSGDDTGPGDARKRLAAFCGTGVAFYNRRGGKNGPHSGPYGTRLGADGVKLYTKTGDDGTTGLFGGERVPKNHPRVAAYGEVDELNAALGVALAQFGAERGEDDETLAARLAEIQSDLFVVGAELAAPNPSASVPSIGVRDVSRMEAWIDEATGGVPPLRTFILPGGTAGAAQLHLARTVCRRAERAVVALASECAVDPNVVIYLNRLGDLLFALARRVNHRGGTTETPWIAPKS